MLINPFTPSIIASNPEDFFGRNTELSLLERSLSTGSIVIQGSIGIGKSSLLSMIRLQMEGFDSDHNALSVYMTAHKDITNVDEAARTLLESFVSIDEQSYKVKFNIGSILEIESSEIVNNFKEGRHMAALTRILVKNHLDAILDKNEMLLIAIDEADKCPRILARLIRLLQTHLQQIGITNVKFCLAGVSPFFKKMAEEDSGITRFFDKNITLLPMHSDEANNLLDAKFSEVVSKALETQNLELQVDDSIFEKITSLSGGHPHLLQLMGAHLIENEIRNPDNVIDERDLFSVLKRICYEDRAYVYTSTIHMLETSGKLIVFQNILEKAGLGFPTRVDQAIAYEIASKDELQWLVENNILTREVDNDYGLVDEFLRIRLMFDKNESEIYELERRLLTAEAIEVESGSRGSSDDRDLKQFFEDEDYEPYYEPFDSEEDASPFGFQKMT